MGNTLKRRLMKEGTGDRYRHVVPNHIVPEDTEAAEHPNQGYLGNNIKTTKYTIYSFLPKNIFEQFHRFANMYFLFIVLLNWVPQVNAFDKEVAMIPVIFVLTVTAIKDAYEDYRRYKSDKEMNNLPCRVYCRQSRRYIRKVWAEVKVGDVIHLSCNEVIPADLVLLWSSDAQGLCYIDTSNIDGENNLKQRLVVNGIHQQGQEFHPTLYSHTIQCDPPNIDIYKFRGAMLTSLGEKLPIGKSNVLLRGCVVRNTDFVDGIVVYAGHETKAFLNNRGPRSKRSKIERNINRDVIWCVIILFLMCFLCSVGSGTWIGQFDDIAKNLFIPYESLNEFSPAYQGFIRFWTYIILFQVMIPLSLYVTIELVKLGQVYFITQDFHMYHPDTNSRVQCRALNITEDLGQVQYIFSDKTGTLTENKMIFKRCSIGGVKFCTKDQEIPSSEEIGATSNPKREAKMGLASEPDPTLQKVLSNMMLSDVPMHLPMQVHRIWDFFFLMAVCNTVVVSKEHIDKMDASGEWHGEEEDCEEAQESNRPDAKKKKKKKKNKYMRLVDDSVEGPGVLVRDKRRVKSRKPILMTPSSPAKSNVHSVLENEESDEENTVTDISLVSEDTLQTRYEAESPDELALVKAACYYGCKLLQRTPNFLQLWLPGEGDITIKVLHILPFDAVRKRMSIIIEHPVTKQIVLYCKGADSSVLTNVVDYPVGSEFGAGNDLVSTTRDHLLDFAKEGLRTLCLAKKVITPKEYDSWLRYQTQAEESLDNREKLLHDAASRVEVNMELLGATGIEDGLQEGVPQAIAAIRQAGVAVWVLTGDKQETALNIAYSCNLISFEQELIVINAKTLERTMEKLANHLEFMKSLRGTDAEGTLKFSPVCDMTDRKTALVIDGKTLEFALDKSAESLFLELAANCSSVLCCRTTPFQKASVVRLVRDKLGKLTLAIGDGANDVSMIQTADVGVGICGQEGMQAVMASDFALPQFKFLQRLLLVHGHWCYDNLARMTLYMFYKNAVFIFMLLWYQIYNGFSGGTMLDDLNLILFNLVYTSLPPVIYGIFDKDVSDFVLMAHPELYKQGPTCQVYQRHSYFISILDAVWQSLVEFFIPYFVYADSNIGMWEFGITANAGCVFATLLHLCIETRHWNIFFCCVILLSVGIFFGFYLVFGAICTWCSTPANPYWVPQVTFSTPQFWFSVMITVVIALAPRFLLRICQGTLYPSPTLLARQKTVANKGPVPNKYYASWSSSSSSTSVKLARHPEDLPTSSEI